MERPASPAEKLFRRRRLEVDSWPTTGKPLFRRNMAFGLDCDCLKPLPARRCGVSPLVTSTGSS